MLTAILSCLLLASTPVQIEPGTVLRESSQITAGETLLASPDLETPALTIRGDNLTIDFAGTDLVGTEDRTKPDEFTGLGILVDGDNITIKNLTARGYKVALMARNADGLTLENCDFSYNYRQRLKSTPFKEDLADWMSYHQNEEDEWLRYGAAVYLRDCDNFLIKNLEVHGGQNGVMLTNCNDGLIHSSRVSFNSGIGIGLYRSSNNRITANRLDFNVRGHSEGVYNRGQDSAALLLYEQSSNNIIDRNSATHSGDGLFLWAGQSTMDTGEGGCNDNVIWDNNFSFAPTNGIEVTFSRNTIGNNIIGGCWHGIWGGYSYDSVIIDNVFIKNDEAINIEHGQDNVIAYNQFVQNDLDILLHARGTPADWGYGTHRDTVSRDNTIVMNMAVDDAFDLQLRKTASTRLGQNRNIAVDADAESDVIELSKTRAVEAVPDRFALREVEPPPILEAHVPDPLEKTAMKRSAIRVTEWGPHDYQSGLLYPAVSVDPSGMTLDVFGPAGATLDQESIEVSGGNFTWTPFDRDRNGWVDQPIGRIVLVPKAGEATRIDVSAGLSFDQPWVDQFGRSSEAGLTQQLHYRQFYLPITWTVDFHNWQQPVDTAADDVDYKDIKIGEKLATVDTTALDFAGSSAWAEGVPADQFATVAVGKLTAPAGDYVVSLTSDDGVRLYLDDKLIHDDWTYHAPRTEGIPVKLDGEHTFRVEHFQIDGYAQLRFELKPAK